jgi:hypothetical protein
LDRQHDFIDPAGQGLTLCFVVLNGAGQIVSPRPTATLDPSLQNLDWVTFGTMLRANIEYMIWG